MKRVKKCFNNDEILDAFISGNYPQGYTSKDRVYFNDTTTIFSYGKHFPLAVLDRENKTALVNMIKHSNTTRTHQNGI